MTVALKNKDLIISQIKKLMGMDQRSFANYQLNKDPINRKIPKNEVAEIIENSIICGIKEAEKLLDKYRGLNINEISKELGLNVVYKDRQGTFDFVYFGLYETPNDIHIYEGNINEAKILIENLKINYFNIDFNEIVLAHEIFHYLEEQDKNIYSNTKKIDLWSVGKLYTHKSKLICTGEIAGMSFSKSLLNLDFDPNIIDYIFLVAFDFEKGDKLFRSLIRYC